MKEQEFINWLVSKGWYNGFSLEIPYTLDDNENIKIDYDSIGEQIKHLEQLLKECEE